MVVLVRQNHLHRRPRFGSRLSLLGDRLPERLRSTTFALLGTTAALGLAVIAVALQEDWPLVPGSPVPQAPPRHQAVGAAVALDSGTRVRAARSGAGNQGRKALARAGRSSARAPGQPSPATAPSAPSELVSSPAAPASGPSPASPGGGSHSGGSHGPSTPQGEAPSAAQPQQQTTPAATSPEAEAPPAETPSSPSPPVEAPAPEPTPPEATASESNVPPWSNGKGHAWGRAEDHDRGPGEG